jgi:transcriptional regulator with XRE-family HTH domain
MTPEQENGQHELMRRMNEFGSPQEQDDYLRGVAKVAAGAAPAVDQPDLPVGQRVRSLREQAGLSLADVAQRTGLTEQALAEIEQDAASPPLGLLIKLGKALGMKLGTLIAGGEDRPYTVVRVAERQSMSRYATQKGTAYGYSYEALAPQKKNRSMEPFLVTLQKAVAGVEPSSHDGEEFIFVLEGQMEAIVGEAKEILSPGDSIYYDSTVPHLLEPYGEQPARILAVIYAPR